MEPQTYTQTYNRTLQNQQGVCTYFICSSRFVSIFNICIILIYFTKYKENHYKRLHDNSHFFLQKTLANVT